MAECYPYPLLVEGDWTPHIAKIIKNKLQIYFQSKKRSKGGDCHVEYEDFDSSQATVWFKTEDTRKRVLEKQSHELNLEKETVRLTVRVPEDPGEAATSPQPGKKPIDPQEQDAVDHSSRALQGVSVGEGKSEVGNCQDIAESTSVVLENVQENITKEVLGMMVENISSLSEDKGDFSFEIIYEINKAVVSFKNSNDVLVFLVECTKNKRFHQNKLAAKPLELTRSVKVENLSPNVSEDLLHLYFERTQNGGGEVDSITMFPEEESAIISFQDHRVPETVRKKAHTINKAAVKVYPYYDSLGTALYGKDRPMWKLPDPFTEIIDSCVWKFLHTNNKHIKILTETMAKYFCELDCTGPVAKISPSPAFLKQKSLTAKHINAWKDDASSVFSNAMSKYKSFECHINSSVWKICEMEIRSAVTDAVILVPDMVLGKVMLAGMAEDVDRLQWDLTEIVDKATKRIERERNSVTEKVPVVPAMYNILKHDGLEENTMKDHPELKLAYKPEVKSLILSGLAAEVFSIKSKVLEAIMHMDRKQVELNPHIVSFLSEVDNKDLSYCIFTANGINAMFETVESAVFIIGNTARAFIEAEKQINTVLGFQCIEVEDSNVIKKEEYKQLIVSLDKDYNIPKKTMVIKILNEQIAIAGFRDRVKRVCELLSEFVNRNSYIEEVIKVHSNAVIKFIKDRKNNLWMTNTHIGEVRIDFQTSKPKIKLDGPRVYVLEMKKLFEKIVASLHADVLTIDKPGAKKFFQEQGNMYISLALREHNCIVVLQGNDSWEEDEELDQSACQVKLSGGVVISVYKADICQCPVDIVVNASNEDLKHLGGLAGALLKAAGPELQTVCDHYIRANGLLKPGQAVITKAGNLRCKYVIHAVGPRWNAAEAQKAEFNLKRAVKESLNLAERKNCTSIAIPAISSGIFGFPLTHCAETIAKSVRDHCENALGGGTLKKIHLVNNDDRTVHAMTLAVQKIFADREPQVRAAPVKPATEKRRFKKQVEGLETIQTKEKLTIILRKGNIQDTTTNVVVNTISEDLDLSKGAVSQAILLAAGLELQSLVKEEAMGLKPGLGMILRTKGCHLECNLVFNAVSPPWDQGTGNAQQILKSIIKECLQEAEKLHQTSITFPAIGTGNLGFPKPLVASVMMEQVLKFSSKWNPKHLQEVVFLVHPSDTQAVQAFIAEFKNKKVKHPAESAQPGAAFFGRVMSPNLGVHAMSIGALKLEVLTGDITKETTDAIVNSSNDTFTLNAGVSKAILDAAGQLVQFDCIQLGAQPHKGIIITQPGNLQCRNIIHIVGQNDPNNIRSTVKEVLQLCDQNTFTSVALPALGTGQGGAAPSLVADAMIDAVVDFVSKKQTECVKRVRIIIFQTQMLTAFHKSMQKREGTALPEPQTLMSKFKSLIFGKPGKEEKPDEEFVLEGEEIDPAVLHICAETRNSVERAKSWLTDLIVKEHVEEKIKDEWIKRFTDKERDAIKTLQRKLQISIKLECTNYEAYIQVGGLSRDVLTAISEIQNMIKKIRDEETQKRDAELISSIVEWQYEKGNKYVPFDKLTNLKLEQAFGNKEKRITVNNMTFVLDRNIVLDANRKSTQIKRVQKTEDSALDNLPSHWDDMKGSSCLQIQLQAKSKEYQDVALLFTATCQNFRISKIERIQNPCFWKSYQMKKQSFDMKNKTANNEMRLFHGTADSTIGGINANGFNRSFAGKNAAVHGKGTYFAVDASYSAHNTYSVPDRQGNKYMYLARVLTGVFTQGNAAMIVPPSKSTDPADLYDSATDNVANPKIFVIFNDVQAYPEYLITFG
ncbi:protein mono-ADP-ribosyltransferase PARP14-like [Acipenser oxyrinchus oxyrinchus]|uniref:Poly [ADP-ribose] polymerase n=1 Tax=Acipenser oxyrinchus oxyrinchus TaxID=40147 RepID=A0AAD8DBS8_ACIOX|nr:protein mono-ADP-ribosyltransferase PARP14-like [Acipenser oxyrinchus oxyrinchus]